MFSNCNATGDFVLAFAMPKDDESLPETARCYAAPAIGARAICGF